MIIKKMGDFKMKMFSIKAIHYIMMVLALGKLSALKWQMMLMEIAMKR